MAPGLSAQSTPAQTPAKTGKAQISGVVVDSLDGKYLSDADVVIEGVNTTLHTDSLGSFRADSLPPGDYQVGVFHPLLDTLGTAIATRRFHVGPDSTSYVVLAVPSAATLVRKVCTARPTDMGASAVIGHVVDPETLQPVAHAEVSIAWTDILISKEAGFRRTPRLVHDSTDGAGAFHICGIPNSLQATIKARHGNGETAEIPITIGDRPIELAARDLLLSSGDSVRKTGKASATGVISLDGAATGAGSRVELLGTDIVAMTNDKGEFTLQNLPSGSRVLVARHLGYGAEMAAVDLSSRETKHVSMKLAKFVAVMDPVLVTARRSAALDKIGFGERSKTALGYFLGPDRIARMHAVEVTDILRQVPGLRLSYGQFGPVVSSSRSATGGCVQYFLDDMPFVEMNPGDLNQFVNGGEIVAAEVYQPGETPGRFMRASNACVTIALWTRFKTGS
jgi:Carboxypeptidase regulatory-like domain/CarboxypepD_reg-like domain